MDSSLPRSFVLQFEHSNDCHTMLHKRAGGQAQGHFLERVTGEGPTLFRSLFLEILSALDCVVQSFLSAQGHISTLLPIPGHNFLICLLYRVSQ